MKRGRLCKAKICQVRRLEQHSVWNVAIDLIRYDKRLAMARGSVYLRGELNPRIDIGAILFHSLIYSLHSEVFIENGNLLYFLERFTKVEYQR